MRNLGIFDFFSYVPLKKALSFINTSMKNLVYNTFILGTKYLQKIGENLALGILGDNGRQLLAEKRNDTITSELGITSMVAKFLYAICPGIVDVNGAVTSYLLLLGQESQQKVAILDTIIHIRDTGPDLMVNLVRDFSNNHVTRLFIQAGESASVKHEMIRFGKTMRQFMGSGRGMEYMHEIPLHSTATSRQEAQTLKVSSEYLNTGFLLEYRYPDTSKKYQIFLLTMMNDLESLLPGNIPTKYLSLLTVQSQSERQPITVDERTMKAPSKVKWQGESECKQDKGKKQHTSRRRGQDPGHRTLVKTNTRFQIWDGEKLVRDPPNYYNQNY